MDNEDCTFYKNKRIAILVISDDAYEHAPKLREIGAQLVVGLRDGTMRDDELWAKWQTAGFEVMSIWDAVERAEIIQVW